jgi:hypothetical protein
MDIKQLKKLIEQVKNEISENETTTSLRKPRTPSPALSPAQPVVSPDSDTKISSRPSAPISQSKPYQNPQDFMNGMRRLRIALQGKFFMTDKNKEISDIIDEIYEEEVNKVVRENPDLDQME